MSEDEEHSPFEVFASLDDAKQEAIIEQYTSGELAMLEHQWKGWLARPKQLIPPGTWQLWAIITGRGWGKTRTGSETCNEWVRQGYRLFALIGRTLPDVRDTMLGADEKNPSGLLNVGPESERPQYIASQRAIFWPAPRGASTSHPGKPTRSNGAVGKIYTSLEPDALRGPQHEKGWIDELATFRYEAAWDNFLLGLRIGDLPQAIITTTPKPVKVIKALFKDDSCHITTGTTYENVQNLAESWKRRIISRYEGSTLGLQELMGMLITSVPGALWTPEKLDWTRLSGVDPMSMRDQMVRIVVAIDPASGGMGGQREREVTDDEQGVTGIIVVGIDAKGHGYTLEDASVDGGDPDVWGPAAVMAYNRWKADRVVGEVNNGGEMVGYVIQVQSGGHCNFQPVWASRGKYARAEPVASLFTQGIAHHVGYFAELESEETTYVAGLAGQPSPNHMDAEVWAYTALFFSEEDVSTVHGRDDEELVRISDY